MARVPLRIVSSKVGANRTELRDFIKPRFGGVEHGPIESFDWLGVMKGLESAFAADKPLDQGGMLLREPSKREATKFAREAISAGIIFNEFTVNKSRSKNSICLTAQDYLNTVSDVINTLSLERGVFIRFLYSLFLGFAVSEDAPSPLQERYQKQTEPKPADLKPVFSGALDRDFFKETIASIRASKGWSIRKMAEEAGVSKTDIVRLEAGDATIDKGIAALTGLGFEFEPVQARTPEDF